MQRESRRTRLPLRNMSSRSKGTLASQPKLRLEQLEPRLLLSGSTFSSDNFIQIHDLGSLSGASHARGLNNAGDAVGLYGNMKAFRWDEAGGMQDLSQHLLGPQSLGHRINDTGQVVGTMGEAYAYRAFAWDPATGMTDIGTLGQAESQGLDINAQGQVVGNTLHGYKAFTWDTEAGVSDLTPIVGGNTVAGAINDLGQMAGNTRYSDAWIVDTNGVTPIGGFGDNMSVAAINNQGQVVGTHGSHGAADAEAFYYDGSTLHNLGTLSGGPTYSARAWDINDDGIIVGEAKTSSGTYHAVISDNGSSWVDLNTLLPASSGWELLVANDVNEAGMIVGTGINPQGETRGFRLDFAYDSDLDTDGDGLKDIWEINGIDADGDGVIDFKLPDADPRHKDLYVEVDAMDGLAPTEDTLNRVVDAFSNAPNSLVNNPDDADGVTLHILIDDTDIPVVDWPNGFDSEDWNKNGKLDPWEDANGSGSLDGFYDIKARRFGTSDERDGPNAENVLSAKHQVYRYCIFGNTHSGGSFSGMAEITDYGDGGNDFMVTLGAWGNTGGTADQQAGTFMHEFGHTLGLLHGGSDHANHKPNYFSVMNYTWQYPMSNYWQFWELDYSRSEFNDLNEWSLSEPDGIGGRANWDGAGNPAMVPAGKLGQVVLVPESGPVRWNDDDDTQDTGVIRNVNWWGLGQQSPIDFLWQNLEAHEDWSNLDYSFADSEYYEGGVGAIIPGPRFADEMTYETYRMLERIPSESNTAPVANHDTNNLTKEAIPVVINVLDNDTDAIGTIDVTTVEVIIAPAEGSAVVNADGTVTYTPTGGFVGLDTFTYEVKDDEGVRSNEATVTVGVTGAVIRHGVLEIVGTNANDHVLVQRVRHGQLPVFASFLPCGERFQRFDAEEVERIDIRLYDGRDHAMISRRVDIPAYIDGGPGRDILIGGSGQNMLIGGEGSDQLFGGSGHDILIGGEDPDLLFGGFGRDIIIGGLGRDLLMGSFGEDILIAGPTLFDTNNQALSRIMDEWTSDRNHSARIQNLRGEDNEEFADRLNDDYFLIADETVFDDDARDFLLGGFGSDWLFTDGKRDKVIGRRRSDVVDRVLMMME